MEFNRISVAGHAVVHTLQILLVKDGGDKRGVVAHRDRTDKGGGSGGRSYRIEIERIR